MHRRRISVAVAAACALATACPPAFAGVTNPNISIIGQPFARWTDDASSPSRRRATFDAGETEIFFDDYLNPYARGTFALAIGEEGLELEEGYFTLDRGLPAGLGLKGGRYRAGFGRLNPLHPHTYPFVERFRVLAAYLPGEESFAETGVQVSKLFALPGDVSVTASADALQGDTFRIDREPSGALDDPLGADPEEGDRPGEARTAGLGRVAVFAPLGERSGIELGASAAHGTNNVAAGARTTLWGVDARAKLWRGERAYAVLQAEVVKLDRDVAGWDGAAGAYTTTRVQPVGGYAYADWNWNARWNAGVAYERFQQVTTGKEWDQAFGAFAGIALLEETTVFRLAVRREEPGRASGEAVDPDPIHTITLAVIFSMGPHKAHQF
jgi:hypothetical protein